MTYYLYDTDGFYVNYIIDPKEQPKNSTELTPPEFNKDYWRRFNGTEWEEVKIPAVVEDIIGLKFTKPFTQHYVHLKAICDRIKAGDETVQYVEDGSSFTIVKTAE